MNYRFQCQIENYKLEKNTEKIFMTGLGKNFLDMTLKTIHKRKF